MVRLIVAWVLITVGLAAVFSGIAMVYMASVVDKAEADQTRSDAQRMGYADAPPGTKRSDPGMYAAAAGSIVIGGLLTFLGARLRPEPGYRRSGERSPKDGPGSGKPRKRKCPDCGGMTRSGLGKCYHCGKPFPDGA